MHAGEGVRVGVDHTLFAVRGGKVRFERVKRYRMSAGGDEKIIPARLVVHVVDETEPSASLRTREVLPPTGAALRRFCARRGLTAEQVRDQFYSKTLLAGGEKGGDEMHMTM